MERSEYVKYTLLQRGVALAVRGDGAKLAACGGILWVFAEIGRSMLRAHTKQGPLHGRAKAAR